ncbi:prophage CP4-57 integrase [Yersinia enterocolitica]|uniref:tyrosine-type recombinase/integrase n=1 Tax=Yersinia enterocolitica TaxID=630 RepID=UPI0005E585A1|nr:tyrosine-type recombinase/integrase [Yersinia enterocolitica]CNG21080.1 prophage CP4-57 integrase [Yersinia enterocolitica]
MARTTRPLTHTEVQKAKATDKDLTLHDGDGLFPSRNDPRKPMNSQTANAALKRIGYGGKLVAHGLRSIASTAMNEAGFNADVIEAALAHSDKNEVRRAYNRSIYLQKRIELMSWWGELIINSCR